MRANIKKGGKMRTVAITKKSFGALEREMKNLEILMGGSYLTKQLEEQALKVFKAFCLLRQPYKEEGI